jgi:hypothetical protein
METFASLVPLILISIIYAVCAVIIAGRKGESRIKWAILVVLPLVNIFALPFLVSKTDKSVLARLAALEGNAGAKMAPG